MTATTWNVVGSGLEIRVAQFRRETDDDSESQTYYQARDLAIQRLFQEMQPFRDRINELSDNKFKTSGRLPKNKAWMHGRTLVIAKSKTRAAELVCMGSARFRSNYKLAEGDFWYPHAAEEGVLIQEPLGEKYWRALDAEEAESILQRTKNRYAAMSETELRGLVGQVIESRATSSQGRLHTVKAKITRIANGPRQFKLSVAIDSDLEHNLDSYIGHAYFNGVNVNWKEEGF